MATNRTKKNRTNVFQLSLDGTCRQIGPEKGFAAPENAVALALSRALTDTDDHSLFVVVAGSEIEIVLPNRNCMFVAKFLRAALESDGQSVGRNGASVRRRTGRRRCRE